MPVRESCDAIRQAALGLQHAFERGLVHRDIKPTNVLRANQGGNVKLLDMGLARVQEANEDSSLDDSSAERNGASALTQAGKVMGTPDYISPEQARNSHTVDIRSDLYSLGCTFHYVLLGWPPFPGGTTIDKLVRHQTEPSKPVEQMRTEIPPAVGGIIRKLLAKQPEARYQTPGELAHALATVMAASGVRNVRALPANGRETFVASRAMVAAMLAQALPAAQLAPGATPAAQAIPAHAATPWPPIPAAPTAAMPSRRQPRLGWPWLLMGSAGVLMLATALLLLTGGFARMFGSKATDSGRTNRSSPSSRTVPAKGNSITFLSDLTEESETGSGSFAKNGDKKIVVQGKPSPKGLAMAALGATPVQAAYHLDKNYSDFQTRVALNDGGGNTLRNVTVVFQIWGDSQMLWQSRAIGVGETQECNLTVAGIDRLRLAVLCGPNAKKDKLQAEVNKFIEHDLYV